MLLRLFGLLFRLQTELLFALLFQPPPRLTRLEPDAGPVSPVFYGHFPFFSEKNSLCVRILTPHITLENFTEFFFHTLRSIDRLGGLFKRSVFFFFYSDLERTTRKPRLPRMPGPRPPRLQTEPRLASPFQLPPRATRLEPDAGPVGSVTFSSPTGPLYQS